LAKGLIENPESLLGAKNVIMNGEDRIRLRILKNIVIMNLKEVFSDFMESLQKNIRRCVKHRTINVRVAVNMNQPSKEDFM